MSDQQSIDTQVAVMQANLAHLTDAVKELKTAQDKTTNSVENMNTKLDTAFVTKVDFEKFLTDIFNPVKKKVDSLTWNLALLIGGGGVVITLVNWWLIYRQGK